MKILLVVTGLPSASEPARSAFNATYANELTNKDDLTIVYLRSMHPKRWFIRNTQLNKIDVVELSLFLPFIPLYKQITFFTLLLNLVLAVKRFNVDVIQGMGGETAIAAYSIAKKLKKPYFLHYIGGDLNVSIKYFFPKKMYRTSVKNCTFNGFESKALEVIFDTYFKDIKNKSVIYRGIKIEEYAYHFEYSNVINLLFLGGMPANTNEKGGFTLLDSIRALDKKELGVKLRFHIGGPEIPDISELVKSISNRNIEVIAIGAISKAKVKEYMAQSHIVLIPSEAEGLPNVMWEAMATGNMVIASAVGGIPEIINTPDLGILIAPNSSRELTHAIINAAAEPQKIENYALHGRKKVESFNYTSFIDNYNTLFKNALS